ncbi:hypothetical protein TYRP_023137 [Tyrophagus putrescentiae]|nr:hypothetical protein TYRP_023137 [Tyrophagus putrescentiae]
MCQPQHSWASASLWYIALAAWSSSSTASSQSHWKAVPPGRLPPSPLCQRHDVSVACLGW